VPASCVARWDGTTWSPLGTGMNGVVRALAVDRSGNLYAGGSFTTAGGVSASRIAKWNGTSWSALGAGVNQNVYTLAFDADGRLYAGGGFTTAGGASANHVARWSGSSWSTLGSGTSDATSTMTVDGRGNVYCGGYFLAAGNKGSGNFGIWHGEALVGVPWRPEASATLELRAAPNPFMWSTVVSFDLPRTGNVRLEVYDVSGRLVRTLVSESQPAGTHAVSWDGRDDNGRRQAAGVYHYRLQAGAFAATRRLVLVR
jgi:hypothetical protein